MRTVGIKATSRMTSADTQERMRPLRDRKDLRLTSRNEVIRAVRDWWEAWFSGDIEVLAALTCERYMEFAGDNTIPVAGKTALLEQARKTGGMVKVFEWAIMKPEVSRIEDAAVCNYHFWIAGALGRTRVSMEGLVTDVLVWVGDVWKLVAHHGIFPTAQARSSDCNNPTEVFRDAPVLDESISPPKHPFHVEVQSLRPRSHTPTHLTSRQNSSSENFAMRTPIPPGKSP